MMSVAFLKPRYWLLWCAFALLWCATALPYAVQRPLGFALGHFIRLCARRRRLITQTNIALCFPDMTARAQHRLVRAHFASLGMGLIEMGMLWWAPRWRLRRLITIDGLQNLDAAAQRGHGVVLLTAHFTTLEIGGGMLNLFARTCAMYRPNRNPLLDWAIRRGRERFAEYCIPRDDVRGFLRSLKKRKTVWYAPDQGFRGKNHVVVPFFGIPAATNPATARLAHITRASVVPYFIERLPGLRGYHIRLLPALEQFPAGDDVADTTRINKIIEEAVRRCPEQYLWSHDRFKKVPRQSRS